MILVDTSVWIEHLRAGNERLAYLLYEQQVYCHPFVIGELACGHLKKRQEILRMLSALPQAHLAESTEVLEFLETRYLFGCGIGWTDTNLLASAILTGCRLWTLDKSLQNAATVLGISVV